MQYPARVVLLVWFAFLAACGDNNASTGPDAAGPFTLFVEDAP